MTCAAVVVVTVAGWWVLLGWRIIRTPGTDTYSHSPYGARHIAAFVGVLAALAVWVGHRCGGPSWRFSFELLGAPALSAVTVATCYGFSAQREMPNDGLWPVGAAYLFVVSLIGLVLVIVVSFLVQALFERGRRRTQL